MARTKTFMVVGMAGAGKTTFCQRMYSWFSEGSSSKDGLSSAITSINLDPAVKNPKMPLSVDIRDSVDFYETMKKYNLGPNGATNTCLNIFMLQFIKPEDTEYTIIDTPGQIEAITWSSPGEILFKLYSDACILYVIDIELCKEKRVFMSNMLFAAFLKCKYRRPVFLVFNKTDLADIGSVRDWIADFEAFKAVLTEKEADLGSIVLYFEEFYASIEFICVSSLTGEGKKEFMAAVEKAYS